MNKAFFFMFCQKQSWNIEKIIKYTRFVILNEDYEKPCSTCLKKPSTQIKKSCKFRVPTGPSLFNLLMYYWHDFKIRLWCGHSLIIIFLKKKRILTRKYYSFLLVLLFACWDYDPWRHRSFLYFFVAKSHLAVLDWSWLLHWLDVKPAGDKKKHKHQK